MKSQRMVWHFQGHRLVQETVLITPAKARQLLSFSIGNRSMSSERSRYLNRAVRKGIFVGIQPIIFNSEEKLIDGHHRLKAIANGDSPQWVMLLRGFPKEWEDIVDGNRERSLKDNIQMYLKVDRPARVASGLKMCIELAAGTAKFVRNTKDYLEWSPFFLDGINKVNDVFERRTPIGVTAVVGALAFAYPRGKAKVLKLARGWYTGAEFERGSPIANASQYLLTHMKQHGWGGGGGSVRTRVARIVLNAMMEEMEGRKREIGSEPPETPGGLDYFREAYTDPEMWALAEEWIPNLRARVHVPKLVAKAAS